MPIAMPMPMQQVPLTHWLEQQQYIPNPSEHRYSTHDTWWVILISLPPSLISPQLHSINRSRLSWPYKDGRRQG